MQNGNCFWYDWPEGSLAVDTMSNSDFISQILENYFIWNNSARQFPMSRRVGSLPYLPMGDPPSKFELVNNSTVIDCSK